MASFTRGVLSQIAKLSQFFGSTLAALVLSGCISISGTTLTLFLEEGGDVDPLLGTLSFPSGGLLLNSLSSPTTFEVNGYCPNPGDTVTVTGTIGGVTTCGDDQLFSFTVDASGLVPGSTTYVLNVDDSSGNGPAAGNLIVDTILPTYAAAGSPSSTASLYAEGTSVLIDITLSEAVVLDTAAQSSLSLDLNTGGTATYLSGSGTDVIRLRYTVANGEVAPELNWTGTAALTQSSGNATDLNGNPVNWTLPAVTSPPPFGTFNIDGSISAPVISSLDFLNGSTTLNGSGVVRILVTYSEDVAISGGSPTIELDLDPTPRLATYNNLAPENTATQKVFEYAITNGATGDVSPDLDVTGVAAFDPAGATVEGTPSGVAAINDLPAGSLSSTYNLIVDGRNPTYDSIGATPTPSSGILNDAGSAAINITFNELLSINLGTGSISLTLNSGGTADCTSVTGSTLQCSYDVDPAQNANPLDYSSSVALNIAGGATLRDLAGNDVIPTLNYGANGDLAGEGIVVDTIAPSVTALQFGAAGDTAASFSNGQNVDFEVVFSESVVYTAGTGTLQLEMEGGGFAQHLSPTSGTNLTLRYPVQPTDDDNDFGDNGGDLALTGTATLTDAAGNAANLSLAAVANLNAGESIAIDGVVPTVTNVELLETAGVFAPGQNLDFRITFSEPVELSATATANRFPVDLDSTTTRYAEFNAVTGTLPQTQWIYRYSPVAGDFVDNLAHPTSTSVTVTGAAIQDQAGNELASYALPDANIATMQALNVDVDGVAPTIENITLTGGSYGTGQENGPHGEAIDLELTVEFSEAVTFTGANTDFTLPLNTGGSAVFGGTSGTDTIIFTYDISNTDNVSALEYVAGSLSVINGGTIRDGAGNDAVLTLPTIGAGGGTSISDDRPAIVIDGVPPRLIGLTVPSFDGSGTPSPTTAYYVDTDSLDITAQFNEPVLITVANPRIALTGGLTAEYVPVGTLPGNDDREDIIFRHAVTTADGEIDDIEFTGTQLDLNTAEIRDRAGNLIETAGLAYQAQGTAPGTPTGSNGWFGGARSDIHIDTVAPVLSEISAGAKSPADPQAGDTVGLGATLNISLDFSEDVQLTGASADSDLVARIAMNDLGSGAYRDVPYTGIRQLGNHLILPYTVASGDFVDPVSMVSLNLASGNVTDLAGNPAALTLPTTPGLRMVDEATIVSGVPQPTIDSIAWATATTAGDYSLEAGDNTLYIDVTFSADVTADADNVTTFAYFPLEGGRLASYDSSPATDTVRFAYVVQVGDDVNDLAVAATAPTLTFAGGGEIVSTVGGVDVDPAVNALTLDTGRNIDGIVPTVIGMVGPGQSATPTRTVFAENDDIDIRVQFSEAVHIIGSPRFETSTGGFAIWTAAIPGNNDIDDPQFRYNVGAGENSADLGYTSATINLSGGSVQDLAGNPATLTLLASGTAIGTPVAASEGWMGGAVSEIVTDTVAPNIVSMEIDEWTGPGPDDYISDGTGSLSIDVRLDGTFSNPTFTAAVTSTTTAPASIELNAEDSAGDPIVVGDISNPPILGPGPAGCGNDCLRFIYDVGAADTTSGNLLEVATFSFPSGSIADEAGNALPISPVIGDNGTATPVRIVPPPQLQAFEITNTPGSGFFSGGQFIRVEAIFDENVDVDPGTGVAPTLTLTAGSLTKVLTLNHTNDLETGSPIPPWTGVDRVEFIAEISTSEAGDARLDMASATAIVVNSGSITRAGTTTVDALLTHPNGPGTGNDIYDEDVYIDGIAPTFAASPRLVGFVNSISTTSFEYTNLDGVDLVDLDATDNLTASDDLSIQVILDATGCDTSSIPAISYRAPELMADSLGTSVMVSLPTVSPTYGISSRSWNSTILLEDGLPAGTDYAHGERQVAVRLADEAGNSTCAFATIDFHDVPNVEATYPLNGSNWMDYVLNDGAYSLYRPAFADASDAACATTDTDCLHAGELRVVDLPAIECADIDDIREMSGGTEVTAFNWICVDEDPIDYRNGSKLYSTGLTRGKGLKDLLTDVEVGSDFVNRRISVTLSTGAGGHEVESVDEGWWTNDVYTIPGEVPTAAMTTFSEFTPTLPTASAGAEGKIYLIRAPGAGGEVESSTLSAAVDKVAFVVAPSTILRHNSNPGVGCDVPGSGVTALGGGETCAFALLRSFAWIEGDIRGTVGVTQRHVFVGPSGAHNRIHATGFANAGIRSLEISGNNTRVTDVRIGNIASASISNGDRTSYSRVTATQSWDGPAFVSLGGEHRYSEVAVIGAGTVDWDGATLGNGTYGIRLNNTPAHVLTAVTVFSAGHAIERAGTTGLDHVIHNALLVNNERSGLRVVNSARDATVGQLAAIHQRLSGIAFAGTASTASTRFTGNILSVDNDSSDCSGGVASGEPGISTAATCAIPAPNPNGSDFDSISPAVATNELFNGELAFSSTILTPNDRSGFTGPLARDAVDDFYNLPQFVGVMPPSPAGAIDFDSFMRGTRCVSDCYFYDSRLESGDTVFRTAAYESSTSGSSTFSPTGGACAGDLDVSAATVPDDVRFGLLHNGEYHLSHAIELNDDQIGDNDGLCEADEHCLLAENYGAYQGHGELTDYCTVSAGAGIARRARIYKYQTNGL